MTGPDGVVWPHNALSLNLRPPVLAETSPYPIIYLRAHLTHRPLPTRLNHCLSTISFVIPSSPKRKYRVGSLYGELMAGFSIITSGIGYSRLLEIGRATTKTGIELVNRTLRRGRITYSHDCDYAFRSLHSSAGILLILALAHLQAL